MRTNPDISCRLVPSPSRYEIRWKRGKCGNTKIPGGFCASRAPPPNMQMFYPRTMVLQNKVNQTTKIRAKAKEADKVWDERYIQRKMKDNPPSSTLRARRASFIPVVYLICTARKGTACRVLSRYT